MREPDGLALSSRNVRLGSGDRERALALHAALQAASDTVAGGTRDADRGRRRRARRDVRLRGVDPEYLAVVDADTFTELGEIDRRALIAVAARVGRRTAHRQPAIDPERECQPMSSLPVILDTRPMTLPRLMDKREAGEPIVMVTAYDFPSALAAERAGVDVVLVGDSAANAVLGYDSTVPISVDELLDARRGGAPRAAHARCSSATCRSARTRSPTTRRSRRRSAS